MAHQMKGISVCNPVDFDKDYLVRTANYAIEHGFNHYQFIGPIHNPDKGNIDGMIFYRKYARFNPTKNEKYVRFSMEVANEICDKLAENGVKSYMWHHELELPEGFEEAYPEILNEYGDVEVSHPLIQDFLENKITDFFAAYPKMDGIILTLHETRIPLLKLKNQKLDKIERVKHVTKILFDTCKALGKELIVRPFASLEEDYEMMTKAYEEISSELVIMDKWTQFDWSLTLPDNAFFNKIKSNPLLVETDIFGEYFGKGFLPLMLKNHIIDKYAYCEQFALTGYVSRIDREGYHPFDTVNEVNLHIMEACLNGKDVDETIDEFFEKRYEKAGKVLREIMEGTEDIQKKIFYLNGYYYTELSRFPRLNHSKNHFYIEMMKKDYAIASNEWFIPANWQRGELSTVLADKAFAVNASKEKLEKLTQLKGILSESDYTQTYTKFANLCYVAQLWQALTNAFIAYAKYFEEKKECYEQDLLKALNALLVIDKEGKKELGEAYYPSAIGIYLGSHTKIDPISSFVEETKKSFAYEKATIAILEEQGLVDFIICGGGNESHKLKKEVNFSDTYVYEDGICRIPGTNRGKEFSTVNAHGWFSYEITVKPNAENIISIVAKGSEGHLDYAVELDGKTTTVNEESTEKVETSISFKETKGKNKVRIQIDRISGYTPFFYEIKVK